RATAVLVDPVADVHPGRADVASPVVARPADECGATVLLRAPFEPRDAVPVPSRLPEGDAAHREPIDREGRLPRPVRGDPSGGRGRHVPCCHELTYSFCSAVIASSVIPSAASFRRATSASIASGTV